MLPIAPVVAYIARTVHAMETPARTHGAMDSCVLVSNSETVTTHVRTTVPCDAYQ